MWSFNKSKQTDSIKNFDKEAGDIPNKQYRKIGVQFIETNLIVGSVGRSHELNEKFFYKGRPHDDRHKRIEADLLAGKPMQPIQVLKLQCDEQVAQYFVMDGHHRVAIAKRHGLPSINAEVTEVFWG
jgi:hypothetical protein